MLNKRTWQPSKHGKKDNCFTIQMGNCSSIFSRIVKNILSINLSIYIYTYTLSILKIYYKYILQVSHIPRQLKVCDALLSTPFLPHTDAITEHGQASGSPMSASPSSAWAQAEASHLQCGAQERNRELLGLT